MPQNEITVFKIKNRSGYAAVCDEHLTEGKTKDEALDRMLKALKRTSKETQTK
jgi:hypothetical protein